MKVLYVAPRYHTNQVPIMKGFLDAGDEVIFVSQYAGGTEDYSVLKPVILGYSFLFKEILKLYQFYKKCRHQYRENDYNFQAKFGLLPKKKWNSLCKDFAPDIVIMRDRSLYNIAIYKSCKKKNIPCILYTQTPFWEPVQEKNDIIRQYFRKNTPKLRMTPVLGEVNGKDRIVKEGTFYVPFVIEPKLSYDRKKIADMGKIQILDVGKYEKRKHHEYILELLCEHKIENDIHATIIGEAVTKEQLEYLEKLKKDAAENGIAHMVNFEKNFTHREMEEAYQNADIFLLPSTGEFASVSQLEAMAYSLPVVCSDTNGTSCYIEDGGNGAIFKDNDYVDFFEKTEYILSDFQRIQTMGRRSFELVCEKYVFRAYKEKVLEMLETWEKKA